MKPARNRCKTGNKNNKLHEYFPAKIQPKHEKMKPDITSRHTDLSSKIRPLLFYVLWIFAGFFSAFPAPAGALENPLLIDPQSLAALAENERVILDTRATLKYYFGHIPGAVPTGDWRDYTHEADGVSGLLLEDKARVVSKLRSLGIERGKTIVLYGDPEDPWRTDGRFFWMFMRYGFPKVVLLDGGIAAWKASGGGIVRGTTPEPTATRLREQDLEFDDTVVATQAWIRERLGSKDLRIIDNRTRGEFLGSTPYGSPRGGHIPGALHIPWQNFFSETGRLKPPDTLARLLENEGIRPGQEIVVYCTGGVRSAMAFFVLKTLGYSVRNYDGSWWDWSHNPSLPVENS